MIARRAAEQRTILVVDDDRDIVETLCDILELRGWRTLRGYDGEEAVSLFANHLVEWILMDVRMPRLTGVEALQTMKELRPGTRAVLMSAFVSSELVRSAEQAGAAALLRKPFDPSALFAVID